MPSLDASVALPFLRHNRLYLDSPFVLAPLAGYTDLAFRLLCRELGAGLVFSEMISSHGLLYNQKKTWEMLQSIPEERPLVVQLFGSDPAIMAAAAARLSSLPIDMIDLNMGCPVRKVTKKGGGAALMKDPVRAESIIRAVCSASSLPVSVKFRSGYDADHINAVDFGQMAENAGAALLSVHGRTWAQAFGGRADWQVICAVKKAVAIPVIGNGDILTPAAGLSAMEETGCDAVMVGRGALINPWLFGGQECPETLATRLPLLQRYLALAEEFLPVERVLFKIKNQVAKLLTGLPGVGTWRQVLYTCKDTEDIMQVLERFLEEDLPQSAEQSSS